jgi:hypothetical protein
VSVFYQYQLYPFLFAFSSRMITVDLFKKWSARVVLGVFSLWYFGGARAALPDYLAYCNELVGGSENGYQWFAD